MVRWTGCPSPTFCWIGCPLGLQRWGVIGRLAGFPPSRGNILLHPIANLRLEATEAADRIGRSKAEGGSRKSVRRCEFVGVSHPPLPNPLPPQGRRGDMWSAGLGALRQHCVGLGARWDYEVVSWLVCLLDSRLRGNDLWCWE